MQTFPVIQILLPDYIYLNAKWHKQRLALVCGEQRLSWGELAQRVNQVAHFLRANNVGKGERVAILMKNGVPMFEMLLGAMTAGAVSVPINVSVHTEAVASMLKDSGATLFVCTEDQIDRLGNDFFNALDIPCFCAFERNKDFSLVTHQCQDLAKTIQAQPKSRPLVEINALDYLNIIYSSGTTGDPKGIVHTHQGRRDWAQDLALALRVHSHAVTLLNIGLYSNISWAGILTTLIMGGTCVIHKEFDAEYFLQTVEKEGVTHTAMVPVQYQRILSILERKDYDLTSCVGITSCGSPLFETTKRQLFDKFKCGIIELYGLTEGLITTLAPEDLRGEEVPQRRWASVGKPIPGVDFKLVGEHDREVAVGQPGEIVSRGRITMSWYYQRNDATESAKWRDLDGNVWMRTGDVGTLDEEGFLYIVDRKKDMIISGGQNIYPQDIEAVIVDHPDLDEVAVIGVKSTKWGETPIALVVAKEHYSCDIEAIKTWCNERLGRQQKIADVIELESLPRNANGKILKRELRALFEEKMYD